MTLNPFFDLNSFLELHKKYYVFCKIVSYHQTIKAMSRSFLALWRSSKTRHVEQKTCLDQDGNMCSC